MTACVNKKSKRVAAVVTASLVGALSIGAPAVALATGNIQTLTASENADKSWDKGTFKYSVDADIDGKYITEVGKYMTVKEVKSIFSDEALSPSDYTVLYFQDSATSAKDGVVDTADTVTQALGDSTVNGRNGGVPNKAGHYIIAVINGVVDLDITNATSFQNVIDKVGRANIHTQGFEIKPAAKEFGEMGVYEYSTAASDKGLSDTTLTYNGSSLKVGISMDGKALDLYDSDAKFSATLVSGPNGATLGDISDDYITVSNAKAGTYTVRLTGTSGDLKSKSADVTFTVNKLDLSKAILSIEPVKGVTEAASATGIKVTSDSNATPAGDILKVDGSTVSGLTLSLNAVNDVKGATATITQNTSDQGYYIATPGKYTYKVTASDADSVVGGPVLVDAYVVSNTVEYKYANTDIVDGMVFDPSVNFAFDAGKLSAHVGNTPVAFSYKVTKDGEEVKDFNEAGEYTLELTTPADAKFSYAGHTTVKFTVKGKTVDYGDVSMFVSIDGKDVTDGKTTSYTGSAIEPVVALTNKDGVLKQGTDYALSVVDADDKAVEEIVKPGKYTIVATLADTAKTEKKFELTVNKANIKSAKASADFFVLGTEPTFIGSDNADYKKGNKFDLKSDEISVVYYAAENSGTNEEPVWNKVAGAKALKLSDIEKAGNYLAQINVLTDSETLMGGTGTTETNLVHVALKESVVFTDVDAGAWYAKPVYEAKEQGYMNGLAGTKLFMPEANITRAELAGVLFNMAGQQATDKDNASFPTRFDDVDKNAWFAQSISWASQAGVINGYDADSFGPFDNASREQVACILYNYAKAQGKDVSVKDADAALAKYADGASVSSWAKIAVAWAVENGVMGNGSELNCFGTITRAEVAAMAVNYQPEKLPEAVL